MTRGLGGGSISNDQENKNSKTKLKPGTRVIISEFIHIRRPVIAQAGRGRGLSNKC